MFIILFLRVLNTGTKDLVRTHIEIGRGFHKEREKERTLTTTIIFKSCTSGGGLDELPSDDMLAPSRPVVNPSISHSDVSESLSRDVVLGGDR